MRHVNTNKPKVTTPSCGWQELLTGRHVCSQPSVYRVSYDHCDHCSDGACPGALLCVEHTAVARAGDGGIIRVEQVTE